MQSKETAGFISIIDPLCSEFGMEKTPRNGITGHLRVVSESQLSCTLLTVRAAHLQHRALNALRRQNLQVIIQRRGLAPATSGYWCGVLIALCPANPKSQPLPWTVYSSESHQTALQRARAGTLSCLRTRRQSLCDKPGLLHGCTRGHS